MFSMKTLLAAALVGCAASVAGARQLQQASTCPISPTTTKLSFASLAAGCAAGEDACTSCLCPLLTIFSPALTASATGTALPLAEASSILEACVTAYITPITAAGVDIITLTSIQSCPISTADVQGCLGTATTAVKNATTAVVPVASPVASATIANKTSPSPSPAINNTLRINPGSIDITATGPTFTVAGAVTSPADLLKLMMNDKSLLAALEPTEIAQLRALYTQLASVSPTPRVQRAFAGLVDTSQPINAVELLSSVQDLLSNLQDEGLLTPVTNSTLTTNSTTKANSTSNSTAPATVIVPAPATGDLTSLSSVTTQKALNPIKSGAVAASVSVVASGAAVVLAVLLL